MKHQVGENHEQRTNRRVRFLCKRLSLNENTRELYDNYAAQLALITPQKAVEVFYRQLQQGLAPASWLLFF